MNAGSGNPHIDAALVRRLIEAQFPHWSDLLVLPVDADGWDNRTFRIGDHLSARLPSASGYVPQVHKEATWLPVLAGELTLPIPEVVAIGRPGCGYPFEWSVRRWIEGTPVASVEVDTLRLADDLASFLLQLQNVDPVGPEPGAHSAYRGGPLTHYDAETRAAIAALGPVIDGGAALAAWQRAVDAVGTSAPVWFHGDIATGNLLITDGVLSGVIDFGCAGVGDPACDLAIAWTYFDEPARSVFRDRLGADADLWARGRGWALWKALITVNNPITGSVAARTLDALGIGLIPRSRD